MMNLLVHFIDVVGVWSINPYQRCTHRCQYCIARSQGESTPWYDQDAIIPALRAGLSQVPADMELGIGAMVDAYPPVERDFGLTRLVLEELIRQHRSFCISTKSDMVVRDSDLLASYDRHCDVYLSLCTLNEQAVHVLEPGAPSAVQRVAALHELHAIGVDVNIDAAPWIPGISDAAALITILPPGATIQFAPLALHHCGGRISLLGQQYDQAEIDVAYQRERERIGEREGIIWKAPIPM